MADLPAAIQIAIDNLISQAGQAFRNGNYESALENFEQAWNLLPDPKYDFDITYHLANYLTKTNLKIGAFSKAKQWWIELSKSNTKRADIGEVEFIYGRIAFDSGEFEEAKKYFKTAHEKSKGKAFDGEDKKYLKFLRS